MHLSLYFLYITAMVICTTTACPGQQAAGAATASFQEHLAKRQSSGAEDSNELIGDLLTNDATSPVGREIKNIIVGNGNPETSEYWSPLLFNILYFKGSSLCSRDACCIWKWIALDMEKQFKGSSGRCNNFARAAVRLGFHDAGSWNKSVGYGGADGSIILANEITRKENHGLEEIVVVMQGWYNAYKGYGVGMADLIQFGANVATVVCPLGPRIKTYIGRRDSSRPNADNLLPDVFADADSLIKLFEDKTIRPHGLTALVGAHTTSQQRFVDLSRANDPQDSTPGIWDVKFYGQTAGTEPVPPRVFKFPSDVKLSKHSRIQEEWKEFSGSGQSHWNEDYAREYIRLSLLGVNNINSLTECSRVLPRAITSFTSSDQSYITTWLNGGLSGGTNGGVGALLQGAQSLTSSLLGGIFGGGLFGRVVEVEGKLIRRSWRG